MIKLSDIYPNPNNPRLIKDDKFKKLVESLGVDESEITWLSETMVVFGKSANGKVGHRLCKCLSCGDWFKARKYTLTRQPKYCSSECYGKSILKLKTCPICSKQYPSDPNTKFCSEECFKIGRKSSKGTTLSKEWRLALSEGRKNSEKCKGKNLYNWKGGIVNTRARNIKRYHERRALGEIDKTYLKILFVLQGKKCYYCNGDIVGLKKKAIEHLIPISKGGDNNWINLVYSCQPCNSRKHNKTLVEFAIDNIRPDWLNNMVQFKAKEIQQKYATTNS